MTSVAITAHHDIIVRREAMRRVGLSEADLAALLTGVDRRGVSSELLIFGPCFGEEAATELHRRLERAGLDYVDDFFLVAMDLPDWLRLRVEAI
ncbi:MAG: hypothetical protein V7672_02385 [Brevundimonas sp.]|jgi:surfactin synthase thioesterase subunit|uniref:hypothetical protein n=1 Tax=Brevundimonas sp. TaxID=1871086 RepID=UPI0030012B90